jgi:hypothetical protein
MKHLRWFFTGVTILLLEYGLIVGTFRTHYGPYIFFGVLGLGGAYLMGAAIFRGK